ncbi:MAG TPA: substrate-binding domain-containing protein [Vicinamibacteria bacterium]|nr:substrate-binding domain-containing protein [Vicinamibacteria bacterium]
MTDEKPGLTLLGRLVLVAFVAGCLYGGWRLLWPQLKGLGRPPSGAVPSANASPASGGLFSRLGDAPAAEIGIAYGTEKKRWLEWAAAEFAKTKDGERIRVNLIPMGSLEGAHAVIAGDQRIHVWSPASALYKDAFVQEWKVNHPNEPIAKEEALALTPMVFVMWAERHQAFQAKNGEVSFATVGRALSEKTGWAGIAGRPEWGLFKFGHTHPNESNSGLLTLLLMAYEFHKKSRGLELKDVLDASFQTWMADFEHGVSGLSNSTGTMMRDMVLRGPSTYDGLFVYESVVIDYLKSAEGRWGELHVDYPRRNMWSDNPYYVLDVPWSSAEQRKAAERFLQFLLSVPVQQRSLEHGFRPGNPEVPVKAAGSPFLEYQRFGLRADIGEICEAPRAEVMTNLLASWQRARGR